ncbi:unnamed protein product [Camellia sinensis]
MKRNKFTATERDQISFVLDRAFVHLDAWFQWFNTTQSEDMSSYFWHGRDNATMRELNPKTLTSGLDDYPHASHPTKDERHLDLRCWMFLAADCMHSISKLLPKEHELGKEYDSAAKLLSNFEILNQMHFDDAHGTYLDFGNHTEKCSFDLVRSNGKQPLCKSKARPGSFRIAKIEDSSILEQQLNLISNRSILWTDYGLRSLSKSRENGPYRDKAKIIYNDLRSNLIRNVVKNYQQTGYF